MAVVEVLIMAMSATQSKKVLSNGAIRIYSTPGI